MTVVRNPILPGCHPDPSICRVGDTYYLVTSTFEYLPGLPVFRSTDLVHWEQVGHAIDRPGMLDLSGIASSGGLYAPTLRHHAGLFWLVCTLVDQDDATRGGNFLITAEDPAGPWSDPVWLGVAGIDPSLFFDDDGRAWMQGTRLAEDPEWFHQTEVWVRELDLERRTLAGPEHVVWTGAVRGAVWAEAPHLYKVDGRYYLLAAEGGTEFHHAVSVARSASVTGPYEGYRGNPVLTHRDLGHGAAVVGTGHADLVQAPDGRWWAVLLAMRPYGGYHHNLGRETFLVPLGWEDGWPVFAPGVGRVGATVEVPGTVAGPEGTGLPVPSGPVLPDDPRWTSVRALPREVAVPRGQGWELPVRTATLADVDVASFVGVRQQHRDVDVRAILPAVPGPGQEAGLAVRQSEKAHVLLRLTGGQRPRVAAVRVDHGQETVLGEAPVDPAGGAVVLTVSARGQDYRLVLEQGSKDPVTVAVADGRWLDSVTTGGFLGLWIGVYATGGGRGGAGTVRVERMDYLPHG